MRRIVLRARGHEHVRAVHPKTIELTTDDDLSDRGTCIVGVGAELDADALGGLAGRATITLSTDAGHRETVTGTANPRYDATTGRLVVRRSGHRAGDTLLYAADKGAADLDRALADALKDPATTLTVTVVVEQDDATTLTVAAAPLEGVTVADLPVEPSIASRPRASVPGTPPHLAAALVAAPPGAVTFGDGPATTIREVRPADLATELARLADREVAIVLDPGTPDERVLHDAPSGRVRARRVVLVVSPRPDDEHDRLLTELLAAGVPLRTIQSALVDATGVGRRAAYERLLRLRDA